MRLSGDLLLFGSIDIDSDTQAGKEGNSLTYNLPRAGHARNIAFVLLLHLLLDGIGELVDLLRLVGALKLSVPILPAQVAVLVILQGTCSKRTTLNNCRVCSACCLPAGRDEGIRKRMMSAERKWLLRTIQGC